METLFQDEYINNVVLKRLIKEVKKGQINKTIKNIDYFFELRKKLNRKYDFTPSQNRELELLAQYQDSKMNMQA